MSLERYGTSTSQYAPLYTLGLSLDADVGLLFSVWYKYNSVAFVGEAPRWLVCYDTGVRDASSNTSNSIRDDSGDDRMQFYCAASHSGTVAWSTITDGNWHLLGGYHYPFDEGTHPVNLYIDGATVSDTSRVYPAATSLTLTVLCLGGRGYTSIGTAYNANGLYSDCGIWADLTEAEADAIMAELWNSGSSFVRAKDATTTPDYAWDLVDAVTNSVGGVDLTTQGIGSYADWVSGDNPAFAETGGEISIQSVFDMNNVLNLNRLRSRMIQQ